MSVAKTAPSYTTHPYLRARWDRVGRKLAFKARNREEWREWRQRTLRKLKQLIGYDTMASCPLRPKITEKVVCDGYTRERVEIQTEPGVVMTLYVLVPKTGKSPFSAVIAPHGHGSAGKYSPAGRRDMPEVAKAIDFYNYDYGVQFCRAGFITFCPDARGFGERQEEAAKVNPMDSSCRFINNMAYPLGQTVTGMWAWDLHRLVDYIETRRDADAKRLGCGGLSGGGLQTLWATAFDQRIQCAVISGYLYGYKESLLDQHTNCSCNYVPHLYEYVDMGDVAALIAPRSLLIETGDEDTLNGASNLANVKSQVDIIRRAYRLLGAEDRLYHDVFHGPHRWHGVQALPWMKRFVG